VANDNKTINNLVSDQDDDPTAELELLSEAALSEIESGREIEAESDGDTFDFAKLEAELGGADQTISSLKSDLKSRTESISKLQFDMEQLRSRWSGLEKEISVREKITENLTEELKLAHRKQSQSDRLLKRRQNKIGSLKSQLSGMEQTLRDYRQQIDQARDKEQKSESRVLELDAQVKVAEEKLAVLTDELELERSEKQKTIEQARSLSEEADNLNTELAAARASVSEIEQYIDRRKSDWDKQEARLLDSEDRIGQISSELEDANRGLRDGRTNQDNLNVRLESLQAERDELLKEISQLRQNAENEDARKVTEDKKLLAEQTGLLAGKNFEINELRKQITRTETYADELRKQIQDQHSLTEELQTRQKPLEISLTDANVQIRELSDSIVELRNNNADLAADKSKAEEDIKKELQRIGSELDDAQATIAEHDSINAQLTADLVETGKFSISLESRLSETEKDSEATVSKLNKELNRVEKLNEELTHKLSNKEDAIRGLLKELAKRSKAIESIGEIEDVIHELDDRMSERIDDRGNAERERITRLLIGKIDGQKLRFPLFKNRLTIGRTGHNDIQLKAPYISRRHAVIVTDANCTRIVDWGSKNGVFVNTNRIKERILRNGDVVTIGTADFKFEERPKR